MPALSEMPLNADREEGFRRGYLHGAQAVINAVKPCLSEAQIGKLLVWMSGELRPWQQIREDKFEAPTAPDLTA
jgi:hypothetical protein